LPVVVLGSLHLDILVHAPDRPKKGETLPGRAWAYKAGGLGLAVAERGKTPYAEAAHPVKLVDTHGAGDAFIGALAARWASGVPVAEAVRFANAAAALSPDQLGNTWDIEMIDNKQLGSSPGRNAAISTRSSAHGPKILGTR
jgi:sugar/nucleoside kinase (ribokinase family)